MFDLLVKDGLIVDGTGGTPYRADIAVAGGKIAAVERNLEETAAETVFDASNKVVTPGFVDVHTHYDAQVWLEDELLPSSAHGVTTVVFGNCGVGFAPVRPGTEEWLCGLMEGVEDIPASALSAGIDFGWESFPEFLEALDTRRFAVDVSALVPHGALRAYVMGPNRLHEDRASSDELEAMGRLTKEAVEAGAVGFSSSRISMHRGLDGRTVPGTTADEIELITVGEAMRSGGGGLFEVITSGLTTQVENNQLAEKAGGSDGDRFPIAEELRRLARFYDTTGQDVTFFVSQRNSAPQIFEELMSTLGPLMDGRGLYPQFAARPPGALVGLTKFHALHARPTFQSLYGLPLDELVRELRRSDIRARILSEQDAPVARPDIPPNLHQFLRTLLPMTFALDNPPDYEPPLSQSLVAIAHDSGRSVDEVLYDRLLADDGHSISMAYSSNYHSGDLSMVEMMMDYPQAIVGLGDGGAHIRFICDASTPTFMLSHFVRDRSRGRRIPLETAVKKLTSEPALLCQFNDRGVLAPGKRADLNVIDLEKLALGLPYSVNDFPGGAERTLQDATGYELTVVNGIVTRQAGRDTGARPGRLARPTRTR